VKYGLTGIGAPFASGLPGGHGVAYVVFGRAGGFAASLSLSALNATSSSSRDTVNSGERLRQPAM